VAAIGTGRMATTRMAIDLIFITLITRTIHIILITPTHHTPITRRHHHHRHLHRPRAPVAAAVTSCATIATGTPIPSAAKSTTANISAASAISAA